MLFRSDKYQGTQFKSSKTVTPKIRPGHNEKSETAAAARNVAKGNASVTMKGTFKEEQVDEAAAVAPVAGLGLGAMALGAYGAYKAGKPLADVYKAGKKGLEGVSSAIDRAVNPSEEDLARAKAAIAASKQPAAAKSEAPPIQKIEPGAPPPMMTKIGRAHV